MRWRTTVVSWDVVIQWFASNVRIQWEKVLWPEYKFRQEVPPGLCKSFSSVSITGMWFWVTYWDIKLSNAHFTQVSQTIKDGLQYLRQKTSVQYKVSRQNNLLFQINWFVIWHCWVIILVNCSSNFTYERFIRSRTLRLLFRLILLYFYKDCNLFD